MSKKTWKRRAISADRIREVLRAHGGSVARSAAALGVNRSTLHRWIQADPALAPRSKGNRPPRGRPETGKRADRSPDNQSVQAGTTPEGFRAWALEHLDGTPAEWALLELACEALTLARDAARPEVRLAATARFQSLLKDLALPELELSNGMEDSRIIPIQRRG